MRAFSRPLWLGEGRLHVVEKGCKADAIALLEQVACDVRVHDAVGQRKADAGESFGVIVDDAPLAIVAAGEVSCIELQAAGFGKNALCGTDEGGVGKDEFGREQAFAHQVLGAVEIRQDRIGEAGALGDRFFQPTPLGRGNHQRGEVELPALAGFAGIGKDVVGDAGVAHAPIEALSAVRAVGFGHFAETIQKRAPVRAHLAGAIQKFIVARAVGGPVGADEVRLKARLCRGRFVHRYQALPLVQSSPAPHSPQNGRTRRLSDQIGALATSEDGAR